MNYIDNRDLNTYTHVDWPIAKTEGSGTVTWVDFIDFRNVDQFGYIYPNYNLRGPIGGNWIGVLNTLNTLFNDLNTRIIALEQKIDTVSNNVIEAISWSSTTASSIVGESLNFPNIIVRWSNGTTSEISGNSLGVEVSPSINSLNPGTYTGIKAKYQDCTTSNTLTYTVIPATIISIAWKSTSASSNYGGSINWPSISVIYSDGHTSEISTGNSGVTVSYNLTNTTNAGVYSGIKAYYEGLSTLNDLTYTIIPVEVRLRSISWSDYVFPILVSGQSSQFTKGTIIATYSDNSTSNVTSDVIFTVSDNGYINGNTITAPIVTSNKTITVTASYTYNGDTKTATPPAYVEVTTETPVIQLSSITWSGGQLYDNTLEEGDTTTLSKGTVTAFFTDGSQSDVTSSAVFTPYKGSSTSGAGSIVSTTNNITSVTAPSNISGTSVTITIKASYTYNGVTKTASTPLTYTVIKAVPEPDYYYVGVNRPTSSMVPSASADGWNVIEQGSNQIVVNSEFLVPDRTWYVAIPHSYGYQAYDTTGAETEPNAYNVSQVTINGISYDLFTTANYAYSVYNIFKV